jgi:hypothetical protein
MPEERTTVERRTTVTPATPAAGTTSNVNVDATTGATTIQTDEPVVEETVVRETTTERRTRI